MNETQENARIDPNQANWEELAQLPGVGETLAKRIEAARPYRDLEDLTRVSGLGGKSIERLAPYVSVEPPIEDDPEVPEMEEAPTPPAARAAPAPRRTGASGALALAAATAVLTALLSVGLTLGILLAINGTLNMGRHAQVRQLDQSVAELEAETGALERRLLGIEERLAGLEGLTGRMSEVEREVESLQSEIDGAVTAVTRMRETVTTLERTTRTLAGRADRFDAFLDGLRDLLVGDEGEGSTESSGSGAQVP